MAKPCDGASYSDFIGRRGADARVCRPRLDSGLLIPWNYDELIFGPKPKKPYWPQMNTDKNRAVFLIRVHPCSSVAHNLCLVWFVGGLILIPRHQEVRRLVSTLFGGGIGRRPKREDEPGRCSHECPRHVYVDVTGRDQDPTDFPSTRSPAIRFCSVRRLMPNISAACLRFPPTCSRVNLM